MGTPITSAISSYFNPSMSFSTSTLRCSGDNLAIASPSTRSSSLRSSSASGAVSVERSSGSIPPPPSSPPCPSSRTIPRRRRLWLMAVLNAMRYSQVNSSLSPLNDFSDV